MMKITISILLFLICGTISFSQIIIKEDVSSENDDSLNIVVFENNYECINAGIWLVDVDVTPCDSIKDKSILPSKIYKEIIKSKLLEVAYSDDTIYVSFIGMSSCCDKFFSGLEYINDTSINLTYVKNNIEQCWCGNCPNVFKYTIFSEKLHLHKFLVNGTEIDFSNDIFQYETRITKKNILTGRTKVYFYQGDPSIFTLLMGKKYSRKGKEISTKIYDNSIEIIK